MIDKCFSLIFLFMIISCGAENRQLNVLYEKSCREVKDVPSINSRDLMKDNHENATQWIIVDVREAREREVSMIYGAITLSELESMKETLEKNQNILFYCTIGYRSGLETRKWREMGYQAFNLEKGVLGWADSGFVFSKNGLTSKEVHVFSSEYLVLPNGYKGVVK